MTLLKFASGWVATIAVLFSACILAVFFILVLRSYLFPNHPLGDYSEQVVLSRIVGIDGPATEERGHVALRAQTCVRGGKEVAVWTDAIWINQATSDYRVRATNLTNGAVIREQGCKTWVYGAKLPREVTPGMWRLEGVDITMRGGRFEQIKTWQSEVFRVMPISPLER